MSFVWKFSSKFSPVSRQVRKETYREHGEIDARIPG
jgi:hypothetical protein